MSFETTLLNENLYDSNKFCSLYGSNEDVGPQFKTLNKEIDFKRPINLVIGLQFPDISIVWKVIQTHAIRNSYDYYLFHNGGGKVITNSMHRCKCPRDKQYGKINVCVCLCVDVNKYEFKICVRK